MLNMDRRRYRSSQRVAAPILQLPTPREEATGGCRRGAEIRPLPCDARSKASSGGRPSTGEVPQCLPPAKDPWSSRELLATALSHWRRPRSPAVVGGNRVWRKAGPSSGDMKQGRYL